MVNKLSQRFIWADLVRSFAIFLVILIHSAGSPGKDFLSFPFATSIAAICVPLFVLLSGSLLLGKTGEGYKTFYKKRLFRLLLPWITWAIIYFIIQFFQAGALSFSQGINLLSQTFTSFWFLPMITALYIITPALRILVINSRPKDIAFLVVLWFLAISALPFYKNTMAFPLFVDAGLVRQTFSYIGFYLAGFLLTQINLPSKKILFLLTALGITSSIAFYYFRLYNNLQNPHVALDYISPGVVLTAVSVFAFIFSSETKLKKLNKNVKSLITLLSTVALGTYFIHGLVSQYFEKLFGVSYKINVSYGSAFINAAILFIISFLIIFALIKIPGVKKFIT